MQANCSRIWKDLFDNIDKDEVVLNSCPGWWDGVIQPREIKVRGVHLHIPVVWTTHPFIICNTLAGSSPLQSLAVVGHLCPEETELLSSEDSSSTSSNKGLLLDKDKDDSSSGLERLDSPVEWNRCRQGCCLV